MVRNASNLRNADDAIYRKCYIRREMTLEQKDEYVKMIEEAKQENAKEENKDKYYVIRGSPGRWKLVQKARRELS